MKTELGPDANGLGWVFQYVLTDPTGKHNPGQLRAVQDWYVRYHLRGVPGVAEVATVGGFEPQYQVMVDPIQLRARGVSMTQVVEAVKRSNSEAGGRLLEFAGAEYMIRGRGYLRSAADLESVPVAGEGEHAVVRVRDVAIVALGPDMRRGAADWNGAGEHVSGIVVMREGANALDVIRGVKAKLHEIEPGLPAGVKIQAVYDRSVFIESALRATEYAARNHAHRGGGDPPLSGRFGGADPDCHRAADDPDRARDLPSVGLSLNILSIGGLALAAGTLVDASIVVVEQVHKKLELQRPGGAEHSRGAARGQRTGVLCAVGHRRGVSSDSRLGWTGGPAVPATGVGQDHRHPHRGHSGRHARSGAAALACGLASLDHTPRIESRVQCRADPGLYSGSQVRLTAETAVLAGVLFAGAVTIPVWPRIGTELMPPLDEGVLLYMPSTMPGISIAEASRLLQTTDRILKSFPEVESVLGKAGRASTATDPAPLSMFETLVVLKPREQWPIHPGSGRMTREQLVAEMDQALKLPGLSNSWTMPIRGRMDMLATGMRAVLGLKMTGPTTDGIQKLGEKVQSVLKEDAATRSVFAERTGDGYYLDIDWDREELGRQGISIEAAQVAVQNAIGGETVTEVIDGRARYGVNVRYLRDFRSDIDSLKDVLVATPGGREVPLGQLAAVHARKGPSMIRDENGLLTGYVYIDPGARRLGLSTANGRDAGVARGNAGRLHHRLERPIRSLARLRTRLLVIVPLTLALIVILIRVNTKSWVKTGIVMLAVPFSLSARCGLSTCSAITSARRCGSG